MTERRDSWSDLPAMIGLAGVLAVAMVFGRPSTRSPSPEQQQRTSYVAGCDSLDEKFGALVFDNEFRELGLNHYKEFTDFAGIKRQFSGMDYKQIHIDVMPNYPITEQRLGGEGNGVDILLSPSDADRLYPRIMGKLEQLKTQKFGESPADGGFP